MLSTAAWLAEVSNGNTTIINSAYAAIDFWHTVMVGFSAVTGCSTSEIGLNSTSGDCLYFAGSTTNEQNIDCSTYFAEGGLALSTFTKNASTYQL
jgi:hypothetical protein